jgi:phosphatidylglycerol:prolipoprotein diacylglycerol transferase
MSSLFQFFHTYQPQPIMFYFGPLAIHWYGLLMAISILLGFWLVSVFARREEIKQDEIWNLAFYLLIFGFLGARIYHILSEANYYGQHLIEIFYFWQGGLGVFGALIAGLFVLYFYARKYQSSFWLLIDIFIPVLAMGEAIVRWGNWFNQENFGRPTTLSWGIPIEIQNRSFEYLSNQYFHPTFFYQSLWNLFLFFILVIIVKKIRPGSGIVLAIYFILYALGRFMIEFLRVNYQPVVFGLRLAQIMSILMFLTGVAIIYFRKSRIIKI